MKNERSKNAKSHREYDPIREQNVLLEEMCKDIKTITEGHGMLDCKMDKLGSEFNQLKTEVTGMKSEIGTMQVVITDLNKRTCRIEHKLDVVVASHENRIKRLESHRTEH